MDESNKSLDFKLGRSPLSFFRISGVILLLIALLSSVSPIRAQEGYALTGIDFVGNRAFSKSDLLQQMTQRSKSGVGKLAFWKKSPRYNEETLQRDLKQIVTFYQIEGFPQAEIKSSALKTDDRKRIVKLDIALSEGAPAIIQKLTYWISAIDSSHTLLAQQIFNTQIRPSLKAKIGERFRDEIVRLDQQEIVNQFSNSGFPNAQAFIQLVVDPATNAVNLTYRIETGTRHKFGSTEVIGNQRITNSAIRKQLAFKPGDLFSQEKVQKSQQQIYQLGMFQFVSIKMQVDKSQDQIIPAQVVVKEAPPVSTRIGVGWSREEQVRTFIDFRLLGFTGAARKLSISAKHSGLEPFNIDLKWIRPAFLSPQSSITLNPFYRKETEPGFSVTRGGGNLTYQRHFATYSDGYLNYALERDDLSVTTITRQQALDSSQLKLYNKSGITLGFAHDSSLPLFSPNRGMFSALTFTLSGLGFNSDFHYSRLLIELRRYLALNHNWVAAFRVKAGTMSSWKSGEFTPIEDRFFAGGSSSIRGWARSQLGPKSIENRPIGGNSLLELSAELRYPILDWLGGVAFVDAGNVWPSALSYPMNDLHYAAGLGLRFKTLIAPIRLDVALPVFEGRNPLQIHVSVGQAF